MRRLAWAALCAIAVFLGTSPAGGAVCSSKIFVEAPHYPVGWGPIAVATADFNGDTYIDIATANQSAGSVSVLLNAGDGTFSPKIETEIDVAAYSLAAADLDDDGDLDLIVGSYGEVVVLLGHGDGTFEPPSDFTTGSGEIDSVLPASLDAGGTIDLVVTRAQSNTITVLLGGGDGTFGPPTAFPTGNGARYATLGDFDGNGQPDVVTADYDDNTISLLLGFSDGTFAAPLAFVAGVQPEFIVSADFDDDGDLDVAVTAGSYVSVLKGNGVGSFNAARQYPARTPRAMAVGDFTNDGILDLAVLHRWENFYSDSDSAAILAGDGNGGFAPTGSEFISGYSSVAIATADFDANGSADLSVANYSLNRVTVLLSNGSDGFVAAGSVPAPIGSVTLAEGDYNGDAIPDLALAGDASVAVVLGNGEGAFTTSFLEASPDARAVISSLFTSDAVLDLVVLGYSDVRFFRGRGDGTFDPAEPISGISYPWRAAAGDFNGDAHLDFALTRDCCGNPSVDVYLGNGDGAFALSSSTPTHYSVFELLARDLDGDGHMDVAAVATEGNRVSILLGTGDGTFAEPVDYPTDSRPVSIAAGDLDDDGDLDLVTANSGSYNLSILAGDGHGGFPGGWTLALGERPAFVAVGDLNADGFDDISTVQDEANSATVLLSHGGGKFESPQSVTTDRNPQFIAMADFDLNGYLDLAIANPSIAFITVLANSRLGIAPLLPDGACLGGRGELHAFAAGYGPLAYQWRKDGVDLTDGGSVSGATTATLVIDPAGPGDEGDYDVVVTDLCTTLTSNAASFTVTPAPPTPVIAIDSPPAPGIAASVSVTAVAGHSYVWTLSGNTDAAIVSGQGSPQLSFIAGIPGTVTVQVVEYGAAGCGTASGQVEVPVDFFDVPPGHPFHANIVEIARAGVSAGCGGGNYCPAEPVTRAQMAPFLLKGLNGSQWTPPSVGTYFNDVPPGSFAAEWINYLASQSITLGCGNQIYCPDNPVTRAQMAVFILKTLGNYSPPFVAQIFDDVPASIPAYNFINEIYAMGITGGCSATPKLYCPDSLVTRGQMAVFIDRAFLAP